MTLEPVPQQPRRWRRLLVAAGFLLVVAITLVPWLARGTFSHRFARLQPGMTRETVHQTMGCPPGDYGDPNNRPMIFFVVGPVFTDPKVWPKVKRIDRWVSEEGEFFVGLGADDRLVATRSNLGQPLTLWQRFERWWQRLWPQRTLLAPTAPAVMPAPVPTR